MPTLRPRHELQFSSFNGKVVDMVAYCSAFDGNYHVIFATEDGYLYEISYPV